jgi:hypothetical protein
MGPSAQQLYQRTNRYKRTSIRLFGKGFATCLDPYKAIIRRIYRNVVLVLFFFLVSWCVVRLSPLGTSATNWPIIPAPDDRWWWMWSSRWKGNWQGRPKYWEKTYLSDTLSTTNPTWPDLGSNPGRSGGMPAINCLSYGTATWRPSWISSEEHPQLMSYFI